MFSFFKRNKIKERCRDCESEEGTLHELYCSLERCPFCRGQLNSCNCISSVLSLTKDEQNTLDEYIDDEEEPLKSIIERWENALNKKGRIPFHV